MIPMRLQTGSMTVYIAPVGSDYDRDSTPDLSDNDDDNDGVIDGLDAFPLDETETDDSDRDGVGDNTDAYPNDRGCSVQDQGDGQQCYVTFMETGGNNLITTLHLGGMRVGVRH